MSVVAVKKYRDHIQIAADSIDIWGTTQEKDPKAKLFTLSGDCILGCAGSSATALLVRHILLMHPPIENTSFGLLQTVKTMYEKCRQYNLNLEDSSFLLVWRNRVWRIVGLDIKEVEHFDAIGKGRDFALAALHLRHTPEEACNVACELSTQCEGPVVTQRLPHYVG